MRIIAGSLGGRLFEAPRGHKTHPMSEKARGAIFGALGDIKGLRVLDAFSGSGALSFESISRGAKEVWAIEVDPAAHGVIQNNARQLGVEDRIKATRAYAGAWSTRHQAQLFDVILLDPPFDKVPYKDIDRMPRHLTEQGVLVLSWPGAAEPLRLKDVEIVQNKKYGDSQLIFYKRKA